MNQAIEHVDNATEKGLLLCGLDGANPLGFLAALGVLRTLTFAWPQRDVRLSWVTHTGAWRARLHAQNPLLTEHIDSRQVVVGSLQSALKGFMDDPAIAFPEKNVKVEPREFRAYVEQLSQAEAVSRDSWDLAASFGTDGATESRGANQGKIKRSSLQMVNGGKRQDYFPIIRNLINKCSEEHLDQTLFHSWKYADSMVAMNLRWDPVDDRRYALRWDDPSDTRTRKSGSQLGANRLAIQSLPFFPVIPVGRTARTVCFAPKGQTEFFEWPIWEHPIGMQVCSSILTQFHVRDAKSDRSTRDLSRVGIVTKFKCERYAVDKYQTASFGAAEAQ